MPLRTILPILARLPRFLVGRFHRRRPHRHLKGRRVGGKMPHNQWWSADDRWYERSFPPRQHNELRPLIDGEEVFEAMLRAIKEAREYVYIVGWALTPTFALARPGHPPPDEGMLVRVLAEASERIPVKLLIWQGANLFFQPTRAINEETRAELQREAPQLDIRLDPTARPTHCHHQKAVVIDGQIGFVGGLDLTTLEGDRWDTPGHPLRHGRGWHDAALQIRGEAVADLEENFRQRWTAVTGERDLPHREPQVDPAWNTTCQIVRTLPSRTYAFARRGEFGIAAAHRDAIARARHYIYLENQYLWSAEIVEALGEALERNRDHPFRIVVILPARADFGKYDNDEQIARLRELDAGRGMFHAFSLYSSGPAAGRFGVGFVPIYVHAKIAVIDDEWYMLGSANLNRRGLATDSEMNAQSIDGPGARALRLRLWAEHLSTKVAALADLDPVEAIDTLFVERSREVARLVEAQRGFLPALLHPYTTGKGPGSWLMQELQAVAEGF